MFPPSTLPRPSAPTAGRGRKRPGSCCLQKVVILLCFLHGWLKIRDRAKHLKEVFAEVSRRVWDTYHAPTAGVLHNDFVLLRQWATGHLTGIVLEQVLDLCGGATAGRLPTATLAATARATCSTD